MFGDIQAELQTAWLAGPGRESCPEEGQMKVQIGIYTSNEGTSNDRRGGWGSNKNEEQVEG